MAGNAIRSVRLTAGPEWEGRKVRTFLKREMVMSEHMIARLKRHPQGILVNGDKGKTISILHTGDELEVLIGDFSGQNDAEPIEMPLEIVYEDSDLAIINKPAGVAVHGSANGRGCTLANAMAYLWGNEVPFHPVHRLDRGTSGLIIIAKSAYIQDRLRRELHSERFVREYVALAGGGGLPGKGAIDLPLGRESEKTFRQIVRKDGLPAKTEDKVLESFPDCDLICVRLYTGRTHQIRAHLAHIGHPLLGDTLYGGEEVFQRPALHSWHLSFVHPVTGEPIERSAAMPYDLIQLLSRLRERK